MTHRSLLRQLTRSFVAHASHVALQDGGDVLTYAQLEAATSSLAAHLQSLGVSPGTAVPLWMPRSGLLVLTELALVRLGATYVPLDQASPAARCQMMVGVLGASHVLCGQSTPDPEGLLPSWMPQDLRVVDLSGWWPFSGRSAAAPDLTRNSTALDSVPDASSPAPAAYVMFTSGSTGAPKGVQVPEEGIVRLAEDLRCVRTSRGGVDRQRWAFVSSPAFDASTLEVWAPLLTGGCCVVQGQRSPGLDDLAAFLVDQRITDALLTSALFNALVEDHLPALRGLEHLLTGGDRVSPTHARRLLAAYPHISLVNAYGPTENSVITLLHPVTLVDTERPEGLPIGTPIAGSAVRVDGADDTGVGELWASGVGVALSYLGEPALTAERFVERDGRRWYRTGDLVRQSADGRFDFLGRVDRQVKVRGHRIEIDEVESVLASAPGMGEVAVVLVDPHLADQAQLVAFITPGEAGLVPDEDQLLAHLSAHLPPAAWPSVFRTLLRLPRTAIGKTDRSALLSLWALQQPSQPGATRFVDRLKSMFARSPQKVALESGGQHLSYAALDRASGALAARLSDAGVMAGEHVPVLLPRGPAFVISVLALVRCGAVGVCIDPDIPASRLQHMVRTLQPRHWLCGTAPVASQRSEWGLAPDCSVHLIEPSLWQADAASDVAVSTPWHQRLDADPLYAMFTSGTTGQPKCVTLPAAGLVQLLSANALADFPVDARWLMAASPSFDASTFELWAALLNGATLVIQEGALPSLDLLAGLIQTSRVSHALLTTSIFNALVDLHLPALGGLQQVLTGGERASSAHMRHVLQRHPHLRLINAYGPTECTIACLLQPVTLADTLHVRGVPIGQSVPHSSFRLAPLDPTQDARGEGADDTAGAGELLIGGPGLALGYLGDPRQTAERFVVIEGQRWYRTGDRVALRRPGCLEFLGRTDRQVKLQGQRIELNEVELALASCPGIGAVCVIERQADNAAAHHLAACYTGASGQDSPSFDVITAHVRARLPSVAVPKQGLALASLPLTVNGKIDVTALQSLLDAQRGAALAPLNDAEPATWASPQEAQLAAIWAELLSHARLHPGSHFLQSGGTSLLALHVAAQVARRMGRVLSPVDVLRHPVLADQAELLRHAPLAVDNSLQDGAQQPDRVPVTLTRGAQGLLVASALDATGSAYLVHLPMHIVAGADPQKMRLAFAAIAQRHPLLRLRARMDGEVISAWLREDPSPGWWHNHETVLAHASFAAKGLSDDALLHTLNRPLDTELDGVMRVDWFAVTDGSVLCVWTVHHSVIDEAAAEHVLAELHAVLAGEALPPVMGSALGWASLESAWTLTAELDQQAAEVAAALGHIPPALPAAPAPGSEKFFELSPALYERVAQSAHAGGMTPFPLLLAAFGKALQAVLGAPYRYVSTPFSRRLEAELIEPLAYWIDVRLLEAGAREGEPPASTVGRLRDAAQRAQQPGFQPVGELPERWSSQPLLASQLTPHLSQFAFTWRHDSTRTLPLGDTVATLLRLPQKTARYSLALHVTQDGGRWGFSIEAVQAAFDQGLVDVVACAFQEQLDALVGASGFLHPADPTLAEDEIPHMPVVTNAASAAEAQRVLGLAQAWRRWLKLPDASPVARRSHFLRMGGTSLTAMRMAAYLHRELGLRLDVSAFLRDPTFANLQRQSRPVPSDLGQSCAWFGAPDAAQVLLLVPGMGGHVAGMVALAEAIRQRLPGDAAVAIVDLDRMLQDLALEQVCAVANERLLRIAQTLGPDRLMGVVGFSLGAMMALQLAQVWSADKPLPVWLLDAYAPRNRKHGFWRRVERRLARAFWRMPVDLQAESDGAAGAHDPNMSELANLPTLTGQQTWMRLMTDLSKRPYAAPRSPVVLIQARDTVYNEGLIWRRASSGFEPSSFASLKVYTVAGTHLDVPRRMASEAAACIAESWRSKFPS